MRRAHPCRCWPAPSAPPGDNTCWHCGRPIWHDPAHRPVDLTGIRLLSAVIDRKRDEMRAAGEFDHLVVTVGLEFVVEELADSFDRVTM